ncbi:MAG: hypothetical protein ACFCUM_19105 [Bacteroidales bacterium]
MLKKDKYCVFCVSTYPIFIGLYYLKQGFDVLFLYTRSDYKDFFDKIGVNAVHIEQPKYIDYLLNYRFVKKKIDQVEQKTSNRIFLFTHSQYAIFLFMCIAYLSKSNPIEFISCEPVVREKVKFSDFLIRKKVLKSFFKALFIKLIIRLNFNLNLNISFFNKNAFIYIGDEFFKKFHINSILLPVNFEYIQHSVILSFQIKIKKVNYIFIGQNEGLTAGRTFGKSGFKKLFKIINELRIPYKPHPGKYPISHIKPENLFKSNLPTEFVFSCITNGIISISSTSLIYASHYFKNKKIKVISVFKLLDHYDKKNYEDMLKRIEERSCDNIIFPETLQELKELIK